MKTGLLILLISLSNIVSASKISKAFDALKAYNYFEAKQLFERTLEDELAASAYGLSIIYYRTDNPFNNIDSAYKYIIKSKNAFQYLKAEEKAEYLQYNVKKKSIDSLKELVHTTAYEKYKKNNSVAELNLFIDRYVTAPQLNDAIALRNSLAFDEAVKTDTHDGFLDFIHKYPKAKELSKARELSAAKLFQESTSGNTIAEYETFMEEEPTSPFVVEAQNNIYSLSTKNGTIPEFHAFVKKYPKNINVEDAWKNIYSLATTDNKTESFVEFKIDFPDYPYSYILANDIELSKKQFFPIRQSGKWGFADNTGKVIIPCTYEWVENFSEGLAECGMNGKSGFINKAGNIVIPNVYEQVEKFSDGVSIVQQETKYGVINRIGKLIVPYEYDEISEFSEGLAAVSKQDKFGYIDKKGQLVIPIIYTKADDFHEGLAGVELNGKSGYINTSGAIKIPCKYEWVDRFNDGLAKVKAGEKFGIINLKGEFILPFEYEFLGEFSEDAIIVVKDNKYGFSNRKGLLIIPLEYDFSGQSMLSLKFRNNMVVAEKLKKQGLIDKTGKYITAKDFDRIGIFNNGLAPAQKKEKWGYVDMKMKVVIPYVYLSADEFKDSIAKVTDKKGKVGFINLAGKPEVDFLNDDAQQLKNGWVIVTVDGKKGLINKSGKTGIIADCDEISAYNENILKAEKNSKFAYYDIVKGAFIWKEAEF